MKLNLPPVKKARIELLPLMDIIFLLLVVFIYSMLSMSVHHGMPVKLPISSLAKPDKTLVLSVTVKADNQIFVNKKQVALEDLASSLKEKAQARKDSGVLLFAHKDISYQHLFLVLDQIKMAGLSQISLQAQFQGDIKNSRIK
ncbi:MAG: biopolymer transporter ExbD [Desulfobacula sp.]|jgi:biopolymer transport protein ExbD|uniref:ExbD/TolR family protein n=1 Tax=Desulfobacula sp. TaxID=2593537 RepID=UPI001D981F63|nr:biopolymer transporter ExbD [Desulfobacula sp.]MBT3485710.1 biopolymer transporter ExbD [Desulfobacula sp.]MBT3804860.1 biopolymer transporter ExbD [Desulfobacula sp.]MBT4026608.1 biopolymer transporter ExbD [Desulfobacula sp.]MBT4200441.1 biopolymer transporter ExbD [Desulfobacula sp.]